MLQQADQVVEDLQVMFNYQGAGGTGNTPPVSPPQGNPGGAGKIPGFWNLAGGGGGASSSRRQVMLQQDQEEDLEEQDQI
jgi:hypothetical protein